MTTLPLPREEALSLLQDYAIYQLSHDTARELAVSMVGGIVSKRLARPSTVVNIHHPDMPCKVAYGTNAIDLTWICIAGEAHIHILKKTVGNSISTPDTPNQAITYINGQADDPVITWHPPYEERPLVILKPGDSIEIKAFEAYRITSYSATVGLTVMTRAIGLAQTTIYNLPGVIGNPGPEAAVEAFPPELGSKIMGDAIDALVEANPIKL